MEPAQLRTIIVESLRRVAPEVDPGSLDAGAPLRDQVDLDSMDYLNFLIALHERFRIEIPEADYERLRSLDDIVAYVAART